MIAVEQDVDLDALLHDPTDDDPTHVVHEPCPGQPGVERIALCGAVMHADHRHLGDVQELCTPCREAASGPGKCPTCEHAWGAL